MFVALQLKIEHGVCASVRAVSTGCTGETNALETEFSRQRAGSRSRGGEFVRLPLRPGPTRNHTKALGISSGVQTLRFQKGSGVSV